VANGNGNHKFLFVSSGSPPIGPLVWTLKKEGSQVKYYIQSKNDKDVYDGFVDKVDEWQSHVDWADVVVFDDILYGEDALKLRKAGKAVIGGTPYTDKLETDREFGQEEMKKAGMNILPHWDFTDFDEAIKFVKESPNRYVLKPSGKAQNEKELLFVGQEDDGKDVLQVLEHYKKQWSGKIKKFQLQRHAAGVEVAVGAFFNGKDFITPICVNFEHKRLFPGDIGPLTGELGTSLFWAPTNALFKATLEKMKSALAAEGYVGYIDINTIANARGIYPLEFTVRFGYPTIYIQQEGVTSRWSDFLFALAKGEPFDLKTKRGFQVGVVVAVPPFPFKDIEEFRRYSEGAVILFKREDSREGIWPVDVKLVEGDWVLAGVSGFALTVTGSGPTMETARRQAYNRVQNVMIPNLFYRTDIGAGWVEDSDRLQTWGYLY
jgi:phosphoribosylamine--glycine ligase